MSALSRHRLQFAKLSHWGSHSIETMLKTVHRKKLVLFVSDNALTIESICLHAVRTCRRTAANWPGNIAFCAWM